MERPEHPVEDSVLAEQRKVNKRMSRRAALDSMPTWWYQPQYVKIVRRNWTDEEQAELSTRLERGQDGDSLV